MNLYRHGGKRLFDLALVILTAPFWGMVLLIVALVVRIKLGAPVFFRQPRPGLHGKVFDIIKVRTMTNESDAQGNLLPARERLTPLGRWLRWTSLDELSELINVLRGEMSLVGPRPLLVKYLQLYSPEQGRRHDVMPGITGWAQITGRTEVPWDERFRQDIWYVDHQCFWLDVKILALTLWKVVRRDDIADPNVHDYSEFPGNATSGPPVQVKDNKPE